MSIFLISLLMMNFIFLFMNHPLSYGAILLMQTFFISMITGLLNYDFWYSYILFLIMIGGLLIMFIYMTSIASNEKFKFNYNLMIFLLIMICLSIFILILMDMYYFNIINQIQTLSINIKFNNPMNMKKYFNFPNNFIMFLIIIYLFITLIAIVKITKFSYGSLRQKF